MFSSHGLAKGMPLPKVAAGINSMSLRWGWDICTMVRFSESVMRSMKFSSAQRQEAITAFSAGKGSAYNFSKLSAQFTPDQARSYSNFATATLRWQKCTQGSVMTENSISPKSRNQNDVHR